MLEKDKAEIKTRIRTAFIFAIAEFEREFGYLWNHENENEDLSDEEYEWYEKYLKFRKAVLDNGNYQIRCIERSSEPKIVHKLRKDEE